MNTITRDEYLNAVEAANKASAAYYDRDDPIMSDYDFDALMQKIKAYEAKTKETAPDSPTKKVGGSQGKSTFEKVEHKVPMLSLQDLFSFKEVSDFLSADIVYSVEEKIDGLSMSATYKNGRIVRAETRGDGRIGEDITENAKHIKGLPCVLNESCFEAPAILEVRCEVYLPVEDYLRINKEREENGDKLFANPRNAAAGLLRTKDISQMKDAGLSCFVFNVQRTEGTVPFGDSHIDSLIAMKEYGFCTVQAYRAESERDVLDRISDIGKNKAGLPYWIDGAVVKIDRLSERDRLGSGDKYPRWAVAYKYPPEEKETVIRNIILQTGRTGRVTPVAVFDPVFLAGTKVEKATLHNPEIIQNIGVNIGDAVIIRKAAEIIPEIVRVSKHSSDKCFDMFVHECPACGGKLVHGTDENGENESGAYCVNPNCPAQFAKRVEFWCSRDCMDIRGFGPAVIDTLIGHELIRDIADIYTLRDIREIMEDLFGKKTASNLLEAVEKSKNQDIDRLIKGLGIPGVGRHVGKTLASLYPDIFAIGDIPLTSNGYDVKVSELSAIDGIGEISANAIVTAFKNHKTWELIFALRSAGVNTSSKSYQPITNNTAFLPFAGLSFVITGTLPSWSREEATEYIESLGGKVSGSVSKKTGYLVCGENAGSKLDKAKELGVPVISEEELRNLAATHK